MRYYFLFVMLALVACAKSGTDSVKTLTEMMNPTEVSDSGDERIEAYLNLIDSHRKSIGLKPLVHDTGLGEIARVHSEDMSSGSVDFGHDGFSSRCTEGRLILGGGNLCAENVAMGQKTVQAAFTAWMNSSGHRANIENFRVTHTGFGYAQSRSGTWYWTQIFIEQK